MATSPDENGEDSTEIETAADENDEDLDVKALLEAQFEAIEDDGEQVMDLMKAIRFKVGLDSGASEEVQQAIRALMQKLMNEHEQVSSAEAADAMWSELLYISSKLQENSGESETTAGGEADGDGDEQANRDDIASIAIGDTGDSDVDESSGRHDPAFQ